MGGDDLERGTGGNAEARQATISDWFFRIGSTVLSGIDTQIKQAPIVANGGLNYGVGPNGEIYVQGTTATSSGQNTQAPRANAEVSPLVLIALAGLAFVVLRKKG